MAVFGKSKGKILRQWHFAAVLMAVYDMVCVALCYYLALWFRFDCRIADIPREYLTYYLQGIPIHIAVCVVVFYLMRLYRTMWEFASVTELLRVMVATAITGALHILVMSLLFGRMPISYYVFGIGLQYLMLLGVRFLYRIFLTQWKRNNQNRTVREKRIMIIGAGDAGEMILRDAQRNTKSRLNVCCIIDDDPNKWGRYIDGVAIVGGREDILVSVKKISNRHYFGGDSQRNCGGKAGYFKYLQGNWL